MLDKSCPDPFQGRLGIGTLSFTTNIGRNAAVNLRGPLRGELRRCELSAGQAQFQDIGQVSPVFRRQCQYLLLKLFAIRYDASLIGWLYPVFARFLVLVESIVACVTPP